MKTKIESLAIQTFIALLKPSVKTKTE